MVNVSYDLESSATKEREVKGLIEIMKKLSIKERRIITAGHKEIINNRGLGNSLVMFKNPGGKNNNFLCDLIF